MSDKVIAIYQAGIGDAQSIADLNHPLHQKHVAAAPWLFKDQKFVIQIIKSFLKRADYIFLIARLETIDAGYLLAERRNHSETPITKAITLAHTCIV